MNEVKAEDIIFEELDLTELDIEDIIVADKIAEIIMQLDNESYHTEDEEETENIDYLIKEYWKRFFDAAKHIFELNDEEYERVIEVFKQSEEEYEKFENEQIRLTELTSFLMGFLSQVDTLLFGLRRNREKN